MVERLTAPAGAPCWADLWTSDVDRSRQFYGQLFGWEAEEPNPEFGGYFNFTLRGVRIAGCMGDMGDMKAANIWKPYFATEDVARTVGTAEANAAELMGRAMPVADLGIQVVMLDPGGASMGAWQPGTFAGFGVIEEPGAPSWFELHTRDHGRAVEFYRAVFGWELAAVSDSDEFRYWTGRPASGGDDVVGIMDGRPYRSEGTPDEWGIYWHVEDCRAAVGRVDDLGGSVIQGPDDSPYGVLAVVADPSGAHFRLRTPPAA